MHPTLNKQILVKSTTNMQVSNSPLTEKRQRHWLTDLKLNYSHCTSDDAMYASQQSSKASEECQPNSKFKELNSTGISSTSPEEDSDHCKIESTNTNYSEEVSDFIRNETDNKQNHSTIDTETLFRVIQDEELIISQINDMIRENLKHFCTLNQYMYNDSIEELNIDDQEIHKRWSFDEIGIKLAAKAHKPVVPDKPIAMRYLFTTSLISFVSKILSYIGDAKTDSVLIEVYEKLSEIFSSSIEEERQLIFSQSRRKTFIFFHSTQFRKTSHRYIFVGREIALCYNIKKELWISSSFCSSVPSKLNMQDVTTLFMNNKGINIYFIMHKESNSNSLWPAIVGNSPIILILRSLWEKGTLNDVNEETSFYRRVVMILVDKLSIIFTFMLTMFSSETDRLTKHSQECTSLLKESQHDEFCKSVTSHSSDQPIDMKPKQDQRGKLPHHKQVYALYSSTPAEDSVESTTGTSAMEPQFEATSADADISSLQSFDVVSHSKLTSLSAAVKRRRQIILLGRTRSDIETDTDDLFIPLTTSSYSSTNLTDESATMDSGFKVHVFDTPGFQNDHDSTLPNIPSISSLIDESSVYVFLMVGQNHLRNDMELAYTAQKKLRFPDKKRFKLILVGTHAAIGNTDRPIGYKQAATKKKVKQRRKPPLPENHRTGTFPESSADFSKSQRIPVENLSTLITFMRHLACVDDGKTECTIISHKVLVKTSPSRDEFAYYSASRLRNSSIPATVQRVKSDGPKIKGCKNGSEPKSRKFVARPRSSQGSKQKAAKVSSPATNKASAPSEDRAITTVVQSSRASKNRTPTQSRRVISPSPVRPELSLPAPHWVAVCSQLLHVPDYKKMLQILKPVVPSPEFAVAYKFIQGLAYFKTSEFSHAIKTLTECEVLALEQHRRSDASLCNVYLGDLYYSKQSYKEACIFFHKALEYFEPGEVVAKVFKIIPPTLSTIHAKCGSCYRNTSRPMEGIEQYKKAIEVAEKKKDLLTVHTSLGNLYQSQNHFSEALEQYQLSLAISQELNETISMAWTYGNIGNAYLALHKKYEALFNLTKALDLTVQYEPTPASIGRAYNNLGTAYQSLGDLDKAQEHFDLSLSQAIYANDPNGQSRVYGNIGNLYTLRKQYDKAIPHYGEVLRLSQDEATTLTAYHNRGCAYYEYAEKKLSDIERSVAKDRNEPMERFRLYGSSITYGPHSPRTVIDSIAKLFSDGMDDLLKVLESHEKKLNHIKGSTGGISLSVSLTESNSRTFHRLQDCMVNTGKWKEALIVAEQSKARTLGEMMLTRKIGHLERALTSPLTLDQINFIVGSQGSPVLYLSHTGSSLLGWVMVPNGLGAMNMQMFTIPLAEGQFKGKSFDHHIRYALNEELVENSYEMYKSVNYDEDTTAPVSDLFELICEPLFMILNELLKGRKVNKLILITDTYTSMLPFSCLYDKNSKQFLGDRFQLELSQSLLTMGIMNQLPEPFVDLPADPQNMCIVGNPTIPSFYHNGDVWTLGKLPYAKREAEWVGHILNTPPILEEQATKSAILMRLMRAKVVHIATHGSASTGFLAFSALVSTKPGEAVDASGVLLHPEEVEKLSISPALVVLSSCDSARGTFKAEGVQGMARAFLLAGAQTVMTSLWRVPDESAAVFMRFFYRFLVHGFESPLALQKSILSLRCFAKYSQYIHWSGYQLTGRSIRFHVKPSPINAILDSTLGQSTVFPRLVHVKKLQSLLVENPRLPTDMQILQGSPGVKPSEIAIDFVHSTPEKFKAGVFWINCQCADFVNASIAYIELKIGNLGNLRLSETRQALFILDNATELPNSKDLVSIFKHPNVHIINLSKSSEPLDKFIKEVDQTLIRGCQVHTIGTLSKIDSTQRTVYEVFKRYHFKADNEDQEILDKLAEFTSGSPLIVDISSQLLLKNVNENSENPSKGLKQFADSISLFKSRKNAAQQIRPKDVVQNQGFEFREVSKELTRLIPAVAIVPDTFKDIWESNSEYDSWDSIDALMKCCIDTREAMLLVTCLSIFGCAPIPLSLVVEISSLILKPSEKQHLSGVLHTQLLDAKLLKLYPLPVVMHPTITKYKADIDMQFVYVPQHLASHIWKCDKLDQAMAIAVTYKAIASYTNKEKDSLMLHFCLGLLLQLEHKSALVDTRKDCYAKIYGQYLELYHRVYITEDI